MGCINQPANRAASALCARALGLRKPETHGIDYRAHRNGVQSTRVASQGFVHAILRVSQAATAEAFRLDRRGCATET